MTPPLEMGHGQPECFPGTHLGKYKASVCDDGVEDGTESLRDSTMRGIKNSSEIIVCLSYLLAAVFEEIILVYKPCIFKNTP